MGSCDHPILFFPPNCEKCIHWCLRGLMCEEGHDASPFLYFNRVHARNDAYCGKPQQNNANSGQCRDGLI